MNIKSDVIIIGAGTAGLSALKEVTKITDDFLVVDPGPLGTTCARVGCMPSKALIEAADSFYHANHQFAQQGILGGEHLQVSIPQVFTRVRELRDSFTAGIIKRIDKLKDKYLPGQARFIAADTIVVNELTITANSIIIATGSSPNMPEAWKGLADCILTTDTLFEQSDLQKNIAVIGAGPIGVELGQALSRLGINITLFHSKDFIAGLTDPLVNKYAISLLEKEFQVCLNERVDVSLIDHKPVVTLSDDNKCFDQLLVSLGRHPNLNALGLDKIGVALDKNGLPEYESRTGRIKNTNIYLAGDVSTRHPILHETADEGYIAGYNSVRLADQCFDFRTSIEVVFSQPNIAKVGLSYKAVQSIAHVIGEAYFDDQGRARMMARNSGILRIYASRDSSQLLGAELCMPRGEHIAHLLAWAIQQELSVFDLLQMPFYHPTIEEGVRTALRDILKKLSCEGLRLDQTLCDSIAAIELIK